MSGRISNLYEASAASIPMKTVSDFPPPPRWAGQCAAICTTSAPTLTDYIQLPFRGNMQALLHLTMSRILLRLSCVGSANVALRAGGDGAGSILSRTIRVGRCRSDGPAILPGIGSKRGRTGRGGSAARVISRDPGRKIAETQVHIAVMARFSALDRAQIKRVARSTMGKGKLGPARELHDSAVSGNGPGDGFY